MRRGVVQRVGRAAHQAVRLRDGPGFDLRLAGVVAHRAAGARAQPGRQRRQKLVGQPLHFLERQVADRAEHQPVGAHLLLQKGVEVGGLEAAHAVAGAQNVHAQRVVAEHDGIEIIDDGVFRRVLVHAHLLQNHAPLLLHLAAGKDGVEGEVGEQLKRALEVRAQQRGVEADFFLGGVGVQLAAHGFEAVEDVEALALFGAFEGHVLPEVGQALLVRGFIARADVEQKAAVRNFSVQYLLVQQADTIGVFENFVIGHKGTKVRNGLGHWYNHRRTKKLPGGHWQASVGPAELFGPAAI